MRTYQKLAVTSIILMFAISAFGHLATTTISSMTLDDDPVYWDHDETLNNPGGIYKGNAEVTITNTGTEAWGDFHFQIYDGFGGDATSVLFLDASGGGLDPTSTQTLDGWNISTIGGYSAIDLFYYNDPLLPGESATFSVYTDNTAESLSWFGMMIYPTPVPEPATIAILSLGGLMALRKKKA